MKRVPIRYKLLAALLVPVIAVAGVTFNQVRRASNERNEVERETELAMATGGPGTLIIQLMMERDVTSSELVGLAASSGLPYTKSADARPQTDKALADFERDLAARGEEVEAFYRDAVKSVKELLPVVRKRADEFTGEPSLSNAATADFAEAIYNQFTAAITPFHAANTLVVRQLDDSELRDLAQAVTDQTYVYDVTTRLARMVALSVVTGDINANQRLKTADLFSKRETVMARVMTSLDGAASKKSFEQVYSMPEALKFRQVVVEYLETDTVASIMDIQVAGPVQDAAVPAMEASKDDLRVRADELVDAAEATRHRYVVMFFASTLAALALALLFARSIARPLLSLTRQADEMAGERLPRAVAQVLDTPLGEDVEVPHLEPVTVKSHDEVADVAAALTTVQNRALDLAVEQAVLRRNIADSFVNLGRRTQNLVGRQLDFITQLEQNETDPKTLEDLFRLDHLATRIQRNAESLVVLAGMEAPRTWSQAVPMVDVMRASLGEVEDYQRVRIERVDPVGLTGGVASDVVHLVAELLENGLTFSPPDFEVELDGTFTDVGYRIQIIDHGIGMTAEDLAQANLRLAGSESFTVAPSKYLGHYVAGHLARRLGATVSLRGGSGGGVVATVDLPTSVLASLEDIAPPVEHVLEDAQPSPVADVAPAEEAPTRTEPLPELAPEVVPDVTAPATLAEATEVDDEEIAAFLEHGDEPAPPPAPAEPPAAAPEPIAPPQPVASADPESETPTRSGLTRRVRGQNLPVGSLNLNRGSDSTPPAAPAAPAVPGAKAEQVRSMLSDFAAGTQRARSDSEPREEQQ